MTLCIIKDYESLIFGHRLVKDFKPSDLRHLDVFNPLSFWDIVSSLGQSIRSIDSLKINNEEEETLKKIVFLPSILKCKDLVESIKAEGKHTPENFHSFTEWLKNYLTCKEKKCAVLDKVNVTLGFWWGLATYDILPYPELKDNEVYWLLPIFDYEDYKDWELLTAKFGSKYVIALPTMEWYQFSIDLPAACETRSKTVGIYGLFFYYIYARFQQLPTVSDTILEEIRKHVINESVFNLYKERLEKKLGNLLDEEKELLSNPLYFFDLCEKSIR